MSDDVPTNRDIWVAWRTVAVVAVIVASCIAGLVFVVSEWTRLTTRIEAVEKWQDAKDKAALRELWRRDRERTQ